MCRETANELLKFLEKSPSSFHAVENIRKELENSGYQELLEGKKWKVVPGGKYYVTRNQSSIIAVNIGKELGEYSFQIAASHSDSPAFRVKEHAEIEGKGKYVKLNTEGYGGMICSTWFDRPLSIAGRVLVKEEEKLVTKLLHIDRDLLMIPNLAIHMERNINNGYTYNKQIDLLPLLGGQGVQKGDFKKLLASELDVKEEDIYGSDLFLYSRTAPTIWGLKEEFISAPRLDDLQCAYATLKGFLKGRNEKNVNVYACFDNEEVGSGTKQGAQSTFLQDVLRRVNGGLGKTEEDYYRALASSFMVSADNAHAVHPNHPEKTDVENCVYMNEGIVIKTHAGQKYTSDAMSMAMFRRICEEAEVPVQFYANRSDAVGGSTLGNLSTLQVSINSVDIGLPQLAMHSAYETAGIKDTEYLIKAMKIFYSSDISEEQRGVLSLQMEV